MDTYPQRDGWSTAYVEVLAVEVLLKGCSDKFAALMAAHSQPKSLARAVQRINWIIQEQTLFGRVSYGIR